MRLLALGSMLSAALSVVGVASGDCDSPKQSDLIDCLSHRYAAADDQLNAAYSRLLAHLTDSEANQLRATQRRWIEFRNEACELAYDEVYPGREAPLERLSCLEEKTRARTLLLAEPVVPLGGAQAVLDGLGIGAEALLAGVRAQSEDATPAWLRYMHVHCSEPRVAAAYESKDLCILNHRLVDR